jgi:hypothetical protein
MEPYDWNLDDESDVEGALTRAGYSRATDLGPKLLPIDEIYERDEPEGWVLACCFNGNNVHSIYVPNLPSLIDVIGKLMPYVSATILSEVGGRLDKVITLAQVDGDAAYKERTAHAPF